MIKIIAVDSIAGPRDITEYVLPETITITDSLRIKADTLSFDMAIEGGRISKLKAHNQIYVWDNFLTGDLIFGGVISSVTERMLNPTSFLYTIEAVDWTRFFDRRLVNETYVDQKAEDIVKAIIKTYTYGIDPDGRKIELFGYQKYVKSSGITIPTITFDHVHPSACISEVAEKIGWSWYIDFEKEVHFFSQEENLADPLITRGYTLYADSDLESYGNLEITDTFAEIKNCIIVRDAKFKDTVQQEFTWDNHRSALGEFPEEPWCPSGVSKDTILSYIIGTIYDKTTDLPISVQPSITIWLEYVDGRPGDGRGDVRTIFFRFPKSFRLSDRFFSEWKKNTDWEIRFKYYPIVDPPQPYFAEKLSISLVQVREGAGSDGIYEYLLSAPEVYSEEGEETEMVARRLLDRYARPTIRGSFISFAKGWRAGQRFVLKSDIREINETVWVQNVTTRVLPTGRLEYAIEFSNKLSE